MAVPTYGAILLDPTLEFCLLVQGFWAKASWGFPKGKVCQLNNIPCMINGMIWFILSHVIFMSE